MIATVATVVVVVVLLVGWWRWQFAPVGHRWPGSLICGCTWVVIAAGAIVWHAPPWLIIAALAFAAWAGWLTVRDHERGQR